MICFEVSVNGRALCAAGIGERAPDMLGLVCVLAGSTTTGGGLDRMSLDVRGAAAEAELIWVEDFDRLGVGDTVTIAIVERETADPPTRRERVRMTPAAEEAPDTCAFCHLPKSDSRKLVAGPPVFICTACVEVCRGVLEEDAELGGGHGA